MTDDASPDFDRGLVAGILIGAGLVRRRRQAAPDHAADAHPPRGAVPLADGALPAHAPLRAVPPRRPRRTSSGWRAGRRSSRTSCRCSRRRSRPSSTATRPSAWPRCARSTPSSSRAPSAGRARRRARRRGWTRVTIGPVDGGSPRPRWPSTAAPAGRRAPALRRLLALVRRGRRRRRRRSRDAGAQAVDVHVADSLSRARGPGASARRAAIADLGAGAGFPGPRRWRRRCRRRGSPLVESARAQVRVHRAGDRGAGLPNAEVVCARAEEWARRHRRLRRRDRPRAGAARGARRVRGAAAARRRGARGLEGRCATRTRRRRGARGGRAVGLRAERRSAGRRPSRGPTTDTSTSTRRCGDADRYPRRPGMARKRPLGGSTRG